MHLFMTHLLKQRVKQWAKDNQVRIALTEVWEKGGEGGTC